MVTLSAKHLLEERDRLIERIESVEQDKTRLSLVNKMITLYGDEEDTVEHICPFCDRGFAKPAGLQRHITTKHKGEALEHG